MRIILKLELGHLKKINILAEFYVKTIHSVGFESTIISRDIRSYLEICAIILDTQKPMHGFMEYLL